MILIADDDVEDLELLEEAINSLKPGVVINKVGSGRQVLDFIFSQSDHLPTLIILDYNMPELNALEVLQQLHHYPGLSEIPKVIYSTSGEKIHIQACRSEGALDYFIKPTNLKDLHTMAGRMLSYQKPV